MSERAPIRWRSIPLAVVGLLAGSATLFGGGFNLGQVFKPVADAGKAVVNAGTAVVAGAAHVVSEGGKVVSKAGTQVQGLGGDGAKFVGQVLQHGGGVVSKAAETSSSLIATGVAKPTESFITSLGATADALGKIDLRHPETLQDVVQHAAGAAAGVVLDAERSMESAATDGSDLAISALPKPLEQGVRHLAAEPIKELEKKNPNLARLLRRLPTSILYNYLRELGGEEMTCDPGFVFANLDTGPRKELDPADRWLGMLSSPGAKGVGISGWTTTNCRGSALGIAVRDAAYSTDNVVTIDLQLVSLAVGGQGGNVSGRYIRVEVLPIGHAHDYAMFRRIRGGDALLTSGKILRDEDGPWFEIHPVDDLEVVAAPAPSTRQPEETTAGHFAAPAAPAAPSRFIRYEVVAGDSLSSIAGTYYGREMWQTLVRANRSRIVAPDLIQPGWVLNVPILTRKGLAVTG